jgi:hypothetical protein
MGMVLVGIVEGEPGFQMRPGRRQLAAEHQQGPHAGVRFHQQRRVIPALGQLE